MSDGNSEDYAKGQPILGAALTRAGGTPYVAHWGTGSVDHYVKLAHYGIENALLQLIAETYDLMKCGLHYTNSQLSAIYQQWNETELNSYLVEKAAEVLLISEAEVGHQIVDLILDKAVQSGSGRRVVQAALGLKVNVPTIAAAASIRDMTSWTQESVVANRRPQGVARALPSDPESLVKRLRAALFMGMLATYAQGMALLRTASQTYNYGLDLGGVARLWRNGCALRATVLDKIQAAYANQRDLLNLLLDLRLGEEMMQREDSLRSVLCLATQLGMPARALTASLDYWDNYRSAWLLANLTQSLRNHFAAPDCERADCPRIFRTV